MSKEVAAPSEEKKDGFDKYEIDNMVRTLVEAEEIKADPKKMAAVKASLEKKKQAINSIDGLRKKRKEIQARDQMEMEDDSEEEAED